MGLLHWHVRVLIALLGRSFCCFWSMQHTMQLQPLLPHADGSCPAGIVLWCLALCVWNCMCNCLGLWLGRELALGCSLQLLLCLCIMYPSFVLCKQLLLLNNACACRQTGLMRALGCLLQLLVCFMHACTPVLCKQLVLFCSVHAHAGKEGQCVPPAVSCSCCFASCTPAAQDGPWQSKWCCSAVHAHASPAQDPLARLRLWFGGGGAVR